MNLKIESRFKFKSRVSCYTPFAFSLATFIPFSFARVRQLLVDSARLFAFDLTMSGEKSTFVDADEFGEATEEAEEYTLVIGVNGLETMLE